MGRDMDANDDPDRGIPHAVTDRPFFRPLSPAENEAFLRKQAEFEAAYRRTGDPLAPKRRCATPGGSGRRSRAGWLWRSAPP